MQAQRSVLVVLDGSPGAVELLAVGIDRARKLHASLEVVATLKPYLWWSLLAQSAAPQFRLNEREIQKLGEGRLLAAVARIPDDISVCWWMTNHGRRRILRAAGRRDGVEIVTRDHHLVPCVNQIGRDARRRCVGTNGNPFETESKS